MLRKRLEAPYEAAQRKDPAHELLHSVDEAHLWRGKRTTYSLPATRAGVGRP